MSNVRCLENACSSVRLALHSSPAQGEIQIAAAHPSEWPCAANSIRGWAGPSVRWRPANPGQAPRGPRNRSPRLPVLRRAARHRRPRMKVRMQAAPGSERTLLRCTNTPPRHRLASIERLQPSPDFAHTVRHATEPRLPAVFSSVQAERGT